MLDRLDGVSICRCVLLPGAMAHQLLTGMGILTFAQAGEMLRVDGSGKAELHCHLTLPFSKNGVARFQ